MLFRSLAHSASVACSRATRTVSDLERSVSFYRDVIGLSPAREVPERSAAFLWVGGRGEGLLALWSLGSTPIRWQH